MADRYAVADGTWADPATWDGGTTIPDAADTVYAGGFTVTIDGDIAAALLSTVGDLSIPAGGTFSVLVPTGGRTLTTSVTAGTSTAVLGVLDASAEDVLTVTGNAVGGSGDEMHGVNYVGKVSIGGDAEGGSGVNAYGVYGSAGVTVGGDATGGSGGSGAASDYAVIVMGSAIGGVGAGCAGAWGEGSVTVTGNAVGGSGDYAVGAGSSGPISVSGDATAGTGMSAAGVRTTDMAVIGGMLTNSLTAPAVFGNLRCVAGQPLIIRMYDNADPPVMRTVTDSPWEVEVSPGVTASFRLMMTATVSSTGAQIAAAVTG